MGIWTETCPCVLAMRATTPYRATSKQHGAILEGEQIVNNIQKAALEVFMQFYDSKETLGNWEKKIVGKIGHNPGHETTKSIGDAYEAIRTILVFRGEDELVAWLDEMHSTIVHYGVQASILYKVVSINERP